jgi:hypothetical protein
MLDVHPPHGAVHTWKDFFIHIGAIAVGLLLAIGLEQSVEAMHRSHQRHQLEEDLHAETVRTHNSLQGNLRTMAAERAWLLALRKDVDTMRESGGKARLSYRPRPTLDPDDPTQPLPILTWPSNGVWQTARESALVPLLPRAQAELYTGLALQHDLMGANIAAWLTEQSSLSAFETRFDDGQPGSKPDLSRMTPAQLDEYSALLSRNLAFRDAVANRSRIFDAADVALLNGAKSRDEMLRSMRQQQFDWER